MSKRTVILVRHGAVDEAYQSLCYGQTDVLLSPLGNRQSQSAAEEFGGEPVGRVYHSGLTRSRVLAEVIARKCGADLIEDPRLKERDFGQWEGQSWDAIYAESGNAMDGLIEAPSTFAPPSGETTYQVRDRVLAWYESLPPTGRIIAVSHGGPIACLLGTLRGAPVSGWPELIPAYAEAVVLD